jgi:hypothetical protein
MIVAGNTVIMILYRKSDRTRQDIIRTMKPFQQQITEKA